MIEGVFCEFANEMNVFEWKIFFEGPEGTPYQGISFILSVLNQFATLIINIFLGGIFEARMNFPQDYPMNPPSLTVMSEFWHPNVYKGEQFYIIILFYYYS